jgi:hypothetical protein
LAVSIEEERERKDSQGRKKTRKEEHIRISPFA